MQKIDFSCDWNKKLGCNAFTSIRLSDRFHVGELIEVRLKNKLLFHATIVGKKSFLLNEINDYIAYVDTGYDAKACRNIIQKMYVKHNIDWDTKKIIFYLLRKEIEK
jgi:hypothetical protein